jgi:hypothetical protein
VSFREPTQREAGALPSEEATPHRRLSPRVERNSLARHYVESDIPHVLARVRVVDVMLDLLRAREDVPEESRNWLEDTFEEALNYSIAPYALEIARSLIALEDELDAEAADTSKKRGK